MGAADNDCIVDMLYEAIVNHVAVDIADKIKKQKGEVYLRCFNSVCEMLEHMPVMNHFASYVNTLQQQGRLSDNARPTAFNDMCNNIKRQFIDNCLIYIQSAIEIVMERECTFAVMVSLNRPSPPTSEGMITVRKTCQLLMSLSMGVESCEIYKNLFPFLFRQQVCIQERAYEWPWAQTPLDD